MNIYKPDMIADHKTFLLKLLVRVINKHYGRSMKGILSEPIRRFPHTKVIYHPSVTCNRGNKTLSTRLHSARLIRQEKNKRLQGYARLSGLWVIASTGSNTKRASLYSILLIVIISSLTNHSM